MIWNLSLTLKNTTESAVETTAAPKSLGSLAKVGFKNRRALDSLLAEQEGAVLWPVPPVEPALTFLWKLKLNRKTTEQDRWLNKVTPLTGLS